MYCVLRSFIVFVQLNLFACVSVHNVKTTSSMLNPFVTNGLSHPYHLDESTFTFRDIRIDFSFSFHFSMKLASAN